MLQNDILNLYLLAFTPFYLLQEKHRVKTLALLYGNHEMPWKVKQMEGEDGHIFHYFGSVHLDVLC